MTAKYYFESHVTTEPVLGEVLEKLEEICKSYCFRVADLLMKKTIDGDETKSQKDAFCTARHKGLEVITDRTKLFVTKLKEAGIEVRRYKIEDRRDFV